MGVAGAGKTTVGRMLAEALGWPFHDADDLHPPANVANSLVSLMLVTSLVINVLSPRVYQSSSESEKKARGSIPPDRSKGTRHYVAAGLRGFRRFPSPFSSSSSSTSFISWNSTLLCPAMRSNGVYLRSGSCFFRAIFAAINLAKWLPYAWLGLIDRTNLATSLLLAPLAPLGVWIGVWLARRIRSTWFYRVAYAGMTLTGVKLLWDGLR